jgi:hypothetical protein
MCLEGQGISLGYCGEPVRWLVLGVRNAGYGLARFPLVRFRRVEKLGVDRYGIDGNGGFGLPQTPSDGEWIEFRGGADHVIHPRQAIKITKLQQQGEKRCVEGLGAPRPGPRGAAGPMVDHWVFAAFQLHFETAAEGVNVKSGDKLIPEGSIDWLKR